MLIRSHYGSCAACIRPILVTLLLGCLLALIPTTTMAQDDNTDSFITPVACDEPGSLTLWIWSANWQPLIQAAIDDWQTTYCPGASVGLVRIPFVDYWPALQDAAANNNLPDIFHINQVFFDQYANDGHIENLQPYYDAASIDVNQWSEGAIEAYQRGKTGDLYAAPINIDSVALFYNKDLFDRAGQPYPNASWDWRTFIGYAIFLTDIENGIYGASVYPSYQSGYANWIAMTGVSPIVNEERTRCTLSDSGSIIALQYLRDLYEAGLMPSIETLQNVELREGLPAGNLAENATELFLQGKIGILAQGSWRLPIIQQEADFEWGVITFPRYPVTGRSSTLLHSVAHVVSTDSEDTDLAANLLLYLTSAEAQIYFAQAGGVAPAHPSQELFSIWFESFGEAGVDVQPFITTLLDTQSFTVFNEIWDFANTEFETIFLDLDRDITSITREACQRINLILSNTN